LRLDSFAGLAKLVFSQELQAQMVALLGVLHVLGEVAEEGEDWGEGAEGLGVGGWVLSMRVSVGGDCGVLGAGGFARGADGGGQTGTFYHVAFWAGGGHCLGF
jgi:hypothetical protein